MTSSSELAHSLCSFLATSRKSWNRFKGLLLPTWCFCVHGSKWLFIPIFRKLFKSIPSLKWANFDCRDGIWLALSIKEKRVGVCLMVPRSLSSCWVLTCELAISNFLNWGDCLDLLISPLLLEAGVLNSCPIFSYLS